MSHPRIKLYPHFDGSLTHSQAVRLVSDPAKIIRHKFFPFLQRIQHWTKFAKKGTPKEDVESKTRPIRYASRRDSYIFSHYREILSPLYEAALKKRNLERSILAYRRITSESGRGGKCNIHFANDAFRQIRAFSECYVFALDINQFFETLDHNHIKKMWGFLIGESRAGIGKKILPEDHYQVFKAVTQYSYIDVKAAYRELGIIGERQIPDGKRKLGYLVSRKNIPLQLCTPLEFREKLRKLIESNHNQFGIPQGAPISDLLANLYMLHFDERMRSLADSMGGIYLRYSDDILIILPRLTRRVDEFLALVDETLRENAPGLTIKARKTQIYHFSRSPGSNDQVSTALHKSKAADGLEYLGFRYDGKQILLRNSSIAGIKRKITGSANAMARRHLLANPGLTLEELKSTFNYGVLISKFGRVRDFDLEEKNYLQWTFWTYVRRSSNILGSLGTNIVHQMRLYKSFARAKAQKALEQQWKKASGFKM